MNPVPIALTMGDPAGIGPEIALKAWQALRSGKQPLLAYGSLEVFEAAARRLGLPRPVESTPGRALATMPDALPVLALPAPGTAVPGQPDSRLAPMILSAIDAAVSAALSGEVRAVVTNPISKAVLYEAGFKFPGHTEYIAHLTREAAMSGPRGPVMMLAAPELRTALVTIHLSLREAIEQITTEALLHTARVTLAALRQDFGLQQPRLAIAGLNPHAGEGGALGREEIEVLAPAIAQLRAEGHVILGPMPPDTMFHAEARAGYDAALCLYHDQGLIPVKTLNFHGGVNATLGLPIVRTSPDHGVAFDIAGRGIARADSLIAAIQLASSMASNRAEGRAS